MNQFVLLLAAMLAAPCFGAEKDYSAFASSGHLLIVGRLKTLTRSDDPLVTGQGGHVVVSNGCGYDTALVQIKEQVAGSYHLPEVAAHLELGEFCTSLLQEEVQDYLLALRWNGTVWEVDPALSSRLVPDASGTLWLVEPELLALIERLGGPKARPVRFAQATLEDLATGSELRRGAPPEPGQSRAEWIDALRALRPVNGEWPGNPLYFSKGVSLSDLRTWLAANNSFKPKPLRGSA